MKNRVRTRNFDTPHSYLLASYSSPHADPLPVTQVRSLQQVSIHLQERHMKEPLNSSPWHNPNHVHKRTLARYKLPSQSPSTMPTKSISS